LKGIVTHIQRYSIHDGPGIRTVVFFKGCPLSCLWCCNPETQSFKPELEFIKNLCQQCGQCVKICPEKAVNSELFCPEQAKIDHQKCTVCGKCALVCPSGALKIIGEEMEAEAILTLIKKDGAFYRRSGGGVTLSGGEPLFQPDFAIQLLRACHNLNINSAIETCGLAAQNIFEQTLPFTDLFLYDIKNLEPLKHQRLTGASNKLILSNLRWLRKKTAHVILRLPLIPGFNMDKENLQSVSRLVNDLGIEEVNLMPFHQMGKDKYSHLGRDYQLAEQIELRLDEKQKKNLVDFQEYLRSEKVNVVIGG
jgi:pyruvate formate lyase activating enzyme